jgi:hypothetical protein
MKLVYISGPLRDDDVLNIARNQHRFDVFEAHLLTWGYAPFNPAADWGTVKVWTAPSIERLMQRDRAFFEVCDALLQLKGWEHSIGARQEHEWALEWELPCVVECGLDATHKALDAVFAPRRPR